MPSRLACVTGPHPAEGTANEDPRAGDLPAEEASTDSPPADTAPADGVAASTSDDAPVNSTDDEAPTVPQDAPVNGTDEEASTVPEDALNNSSDDAAEDAPAANPEAASSNTEDPFEDAFVAAGPWQPSDRSQSLSPSERVIPTWTDQTAQRASTVIGGPLGRHALVGRNPILTPLRVALLMAICILIGGWLFKSACIQQRGDGGSVSLDQSGQRPWITGCYNDVVPLYGSRGFNRPQEFPYAHAWIETGEGDRRIFLPRNVENVGGQYVNRVDGNPIPNGDFVGDPDAGYQKMVDGALVPVDDIEAVGKVRYLEYPVVTGLFQWGVSWVTSGYMSFAKSTGVVPVPLDVAAYFTIGAILLGLFYLWSVASTARIARRRVWDTAIMCLSPLVVVHAFTNWDMVAIGLASAGMLAWARKKPVLAGVFLGLGMAAKLYPILLLGPLLVLCLRTGKLPVWLRAAVAAAVAWAAVNIPVILQYPHAWYEFVRLNSERGPEFDSWYFIYQELSGSTIWNNAPGAKTPVFLNTLSLGLFIAACGAIGWFALSTQRRARFAQLAFLVVVAFLITNKVWSPQYSMWLMPLVVLALPRWRPVLAWQFSEAVVWLLLMLSFAGEANKGLTIHPFIAAALVRDALLITLAVMVIRDVLRPDRDLVRMAGDDDPSGGVLEDAEDRFTIPSLPSLFRKRPAPEPQPAGETPIPEPATADSP